MMISVEVIIASRTYSSVDAIPDEVAIHAHHRLGELTTMLKDLQSPERQSLGGGTSFHAGDIFCSMNLHDVNRIKFYQFIDIYASKLLDNYTTNPQDYVGEYVSTLHNMKTAILKGTFSKDSESFKATCKALKIKHTYKAINEFLERK